MAAKIQLRRDTTVNWESNNPVLSDGEIGLDTTTGEFKIGNGVDTWLNLSYYVGSGSVDSTSVPIVTAVSSANEGSTISLTIENYDPTFLYTAYTSKGSINVSSNPFQFNLPLVDANETIDYFITATDVGKATSILYKSIDVLNVGVTGDDAFSMTPTPYGNISEYNIQDSLQDNWNRIETTIYSTSVGLEIDSASTATNLKIIGKEVSDSLIGITTENSLISINNTSTPSIEVTPTTNMFNELEVASFVNSSRYDSWSYDMGNGKIVIVQATSSNQLAIVTVIDKTTGSTIYKDYVYFTYGCVNQSKIQSCKYQNGYLLFHATSYYYGIYDLVNRKIVADAKLVGGASTAINYAYFDGESLIYSSTHNTSTAYPYGALPAFAFGEVSVPDTTIIRTMAVAKLAGVDIYFRNGATFPVVRFNGLTTEYNLSHITMPSAEFIFGDVILYQSSNSVIFISSGYMLKFYIDVPEGSTVEYSDISSNLTLIQANIIPIPTSFTNAFYDRDTDLIYILDRNNKDLRVYDSNLSYITNYIITDLVAWTGTMYGFSYLKSDGTYIARTAYTSTETDSEVTFETDYLGKRRVVSNIDISSHSLLNPLSRVYNNPIKRQLIKTKSNDKLEVQGYLNSYTSFTEIKNSRGFDSTNIYAVDANGNTELLNITNVVETPKTASSSFTVGTTSHGNNAASRLINLPNGKTVLFGDNDGTSVRIIHDGVTYLVDATQSAYGIHASSASLINDTTLFCVTGYASKCYVSYFTFDLTTNTASNVYEYQLSTATTSIAVCAGYDGKYGYLFQQNAVGHEGALKIDLTSMNVIERKYNTNFNFDINTYSEYVNGNFNIYYNGQLANIYNYDTNSESATSNISEFTTSKFIYIDKAGNKYITQTTSSTYNSYFIKLDPNNNIIYKQLFKASSTTSHTVDTGKYLGNGYFAIVTSISPYVYVIKEADNGMSVSFYSSFTSDISDNNSFNGSAYINSTDTLFLNSGISAFYVQIDTTNLYDKTYTITYDTPSLTIDHLGYGTNEIIQTLDVTNVELVENFGTVFTTNTISDSVREISFDASLDDKVNQVVVNTSI